LRRLSTQLEEMSFLDVSGRIARALVEMTSEPYLGTAIPLACAVSQEELARIVGASRVTVNKVLNSFVDLGLVSIARKRLVVLNSSELVRIGDYDGES
jgi:CRP/FNR family transcriptional regulator, cyclic AMP receptor protein